MITHWTTFQAGLNRIGSGVPGRETISNTSAWLIGVGGGAGSVFDCATGANFGVQGRETTQVNLSDNDIGDSGEGSNSATEPLRVIMLILNLQKFLCRSRQLC